MKPASELLADMGYTVEDVFNRPSGDKRICRCGHAIVRHTADEGVCTVSRVACHCQGSNQKAVFEAENIEVFRYKDEGSGMNHALTKGIAALEKKGKSGRWITENYCCDFEQCTETQSLIPVLIDNSRPDGEPVIINITSVRTKEPFAGWRDRLACPSHYAKFQGGASAI